MTNVAPTAAAEAARDEDNVQEDPDFNIFEGDDIALVDIKEELRKDKAVEVRTLAAVERGN